jgi:superfamily II DNA or RNA helicase
MPKNESTKPKIEIDGAWAFLEGIPGRHLEQCLAVRDPKAHFLQICKDGRWDGKVRFYSGNRFPAGLVARAQTYLLEFQEFADLEVLDPYRVTVDLKRFTPEYLPGITLWDHQYEACMSMLAHPRGVVKSPTASGKTEIMAAVARYLWEEYDVRTLVVVPKKGLLTQTVERFERYYEGDLTVGQCGDGVKTTGDVTVGTAQTLIGFKPRRRKGKLIPANEDLRFLIEEQVDCIMLDECHHTSSNSWQDIAMACPARFRYGLSGTPLKENELSDLRLIGATGPVIYNVEAEHLIAEGLAARPRIVMVMSDNASGARGSLGKVWREGKSRELAYKAAYDAGIVENKLHNDAVVKATTWLVDQGRKVMVLCRYKKHFRTLEAMLDDKGVDFRACWGATTTEDRLEAKKLLNSGQIHAVLVSTIWDEGEDVPNVNAIVLAEGVKVNTSALQRVGRGMRRKGGEDVWVVDFVPVCHPKLTEHAASRAEFYEDEGYEVALLEDWPEPGSTEGFDDLLPFLKWEEAMQKTYEEA